ncbi:gp16 family protein [Achromobacter xylosoxidans]|uniref:gp16 family protein n=1 Tax=Alcaligenes xylosoxydans xylosoxydans TaxID=85698 RepID=UPI000B490E8A|nr:regulatory protein GemA [Achromobacter xylosoxidans]
MKTTQRPSAHAKVAGNAHRLIRLIHVAKRELAMDDDAYRQLLEAVTGQRSTAAMNEEQLDQVVKHMKRCGFKVRLQPKPSRPLDLHAESRKIRALWLLLHDLGAIRSSSEEALATYVKRMTGVDALQWTNGRQTERVIESMKKWALRFLPAQIQTSAAEVAADQLDQDASRRLNAALSKAFARGTFEPMLEAWDQLKRVKLSGERHGTSA